MLAAVLLGLAPAALVEAQSPTGSLIHVEVEGLRNDTGKVLCALFTSAEGFPGKPEKALARAESVIIGRRAACDFPGFAPGTYAVSVFHDENSNGRLDRKLFGIPREGVGASNGAKGHFGPPRFEAAAFPLAGGDLELRIVVQYL